MTVLGILGNNLLYPVTQTLEWWLILTSKDDDVIWNIVLAYLNSFWVPNSRKISEPLKCLLGNSEVNENIKHSINLCNPFLHKSACFSDMILVDLVARFRCRVEDYIQNDSNVQRFPQNISYLEASSMLLSCNIMLTPNPFNGRGFVNFCPKFPTRSGTDFQRQIVLNCELIPVNQNQDPYRKFMYCIPKHTGLHLQNSALEEILKKTTIAEEEEGEKIIQKICSLPNVSKNFLISLLQNKFSKVIPSIYQSHYILSKLNEAGFLTDPRTQDASGKFAFSHVLRTENSDLLFLLYNHAANVCLQVESSLRSPDTVIVENLLNLKDNFKKIKEDLKNSEISKATKSLLNELTRFNEYQIEMCRNINNVRLRINYYNEDREEDALERKDIILTILTTFEKYFDSMKEESEISIDLKDCLPRFEEFCLHRDYFDKIDFSSAIMFFDNLFLLKERLELPEKVYLEIESKFFLFIFCRKYLERYDQQTNFQGASRWITFQERLALKEQVCIFKKILQETEISKINVVQSLPESQVRTLINMPQIYGQFVLVRLETYLNIATEVPVKDVKSILIIERCLIVIGECFKETDFKSIQMILPLALPKEFVSISKQIRNTVAHLKDYEIAFRNIAGQDVELFVKIQNDLLEFKNLISPIVLAHRYQMNQFLFLHSAKSVCKARKKSNLKIHEPIMKAILPPPEKERNEICERASDLQKQWKNYFNIMNDSLKKEIELLNRQNKIVSKNSSQRYKFIIQNLIKSVEDKLESLKSKKNISEKLQTEIDGYFWCLEYILIFITKNRKAKQFRRNFLSTIQSRECLFNVSIKKKKLPQKTDKGTNTNTVVTPINADGSSISKNIPNLNVTEPSTCKHIPENVENDVSDVCNEKCPILPAVVVKSGGDSISENIPNTNLTEHSTCKNIPENVKNDVSDVCNEKCPILQAATIDQNNPMKIFINSGGRFTNNTSNEIFANEKLENMSMDENSGKKKPNYVDKEVNTVGIQNLNFDILINDDESEENTETQCSGMDDEDSQLASDISVHRDWLVASVFNTSEDSVISNERESSEEMTRNMNALIGNSRMILEKYKHITDDMFQKFPGKKEDLEFHFENINKYCMILKGRKFLNQKEKDTILQSIPDKYKNTSSVKERLKILLENATALTEEIDSELSKLTLKKCDRKEIIENIKLEIIDESFLIIESARDYFFDLKEQMETNEMSKKEYDVFCEKLEIPHNAKEILLSIVQNENRKFKIKDNKLTYFRNRIKLLKDILIHEKGDIEQLYEKANTLRSKKYLQEKIVQHYLNDSEVRASVEMLLFDCMTVLKTKELQKLWIKTTNLFNGVSLRNVLAHGHPLLESLGRLLDPYDLPSQLVEKMLELISDGECIDCIQQILDQTGTDFTGFVKIMNDDEDDIFKQLREKILCSSRWREYAFLIPVT
ncbi:uncharacterized protein CDAR_530041 [Caerostris darwini]|uniref:Uncharacterized protein n=1 Tax=Caerostris darwini TaxID=1538125 RepID=A0AAV4S090_9ARAC|nr:uncharacterized protein CDAR_530041 [Caerostris darwini]